MSSRKITAKDRRYAEHRKAGEKHETAWRAAYKTKPPAVADVPEAILSLIGGDSIEEFESAHEIASIQELKIFWTEVMRDKTAKVSERISAAAELAKAKGLFAAANRKKPNEEPKLTDQQISERIAKHIKEMAENE